MKDVNQEKDISDSPKPVSLQSMKEIICQMENGVCKIFKNGFKGTGFFCQIPFPDYNNLLKVLVTNNHVINENDLKGSFDILLKDKTKNIKVGESRKIYTNKKYDITFIEIIPEEDGINYFLKIDNIIDNKLENLTDVLIKKSIYILHYPRGEDIFISYGLSNNLFENKLNHICCTEHGSSGSPILSLDNLKVIGIHCGSAKTPFNFNVGTFIKNPINEFYNDYKNRIKYQELTIKYKINSSLPKINIFSEDFVNNNKENLFILFDETEKELCDCLYMNEISKKDNLDFFEIKLRIRKNKKLTNLSRMFQWCENLYSLSEDFNFDTSHVLDMSNLFLGCSRLTSVSVISNWDTSKNTNMKCMFAKCKSLESIPDISNWNISNVQSLEYLFNECSSLKKLPDISKWNTSKINSMSCLFRKCSSLETLPDISKWDISKVNNIGSMFDECTSLLNLPDISQWNTTNIENMENLFSECRLLESLPNISKWDISKVLNISMIFSNCKKISSLPDISRWNTVNINNMKHLFDGCISLNSLPDISQWNTINVKDMRFMFRNCISLKSLPDLSKWNTNSVNNLNYMFSGCNKLETIPNISIWKIPNGSKFNKIFENCNSLKNIPDVSNWNKNSKK